jgi:hypothetical protein
MRGGFAYVKISGQINEKKEAIADRLQPAEPSNETII